MPTHAKLNPVPQEHGAKDLSQFFMEETCLQMLKHGNRAENMRFTALYLCECIPDAGRALSELIFKGLEREWQPSVISRRNFVPSAPRRDNRG